ncbi:DUF2914 domain-containing protein [Geothermobacter hydrogeniphilus]|uniref:DUF2914 domain-containing protein n=1 Tax=Geothermobacter hydrogeniphilus TaxID=1969733 RepID=A0A1X0Y5U8_9BACT|nr:DUF2914 domain-containing protein [Geothermobacter hydrogeniphilus]ORJ60523.1 hypothetical protein B5V00_08145 [Geothermobacter hydrogeniphilus]
MKKMMIVLTLLLLLPSLGWGLEVVEGVVATGVEQRQPVGVADHFPADIGRVYCFTRVRGAVGDDEITHVWLKQGREMARVTLAVRSDNWRTWSSKQVLPEWRGAWTVKVLDRAGNELTSISFDLE